MYNFGLVVSINLVTVGLLCGNAGLLTRAEKNILIFEQNMQRSMCKPIRMHSCNFCILMRSRSMNDVSRIVEGQRQRQRTIQDGRVGNISPIAL